MRTADTQDSRKQPPRDEPYAKPIERMVALQLRARGIRSEAVLHAMSRVPRHRFVPPTLAGVAYTDQPLPVGEGQTISQPYMVALMTESLDIAPRSRVLEIGTGSGYQAAILATLGAHLWTIERSPTLSVRAESRLLSLGFEAIHCLIGDGTAGWPVEAPYDAIIATGSLPDVPQVLLDQLASKGVLVAPVGSRSEQELLRITYHERQRESAVLCACRFVPLIGEHGWSTTSPGSG